MSSIKKFFITLFGILTGISYEIVYPIIAGVLLISVFGSFKGMTDIYEKVVTAFLMFYILKKITKVGSKDANEDVNKKLDFIISKLGATEEFKELTNKELDTDGKPKKENEFNKIFVEVLAATAIALFFIYKYIIKS